MANLQRYRTSGQVHRIDQHFSTPFTFTSHPSLKFPIQRPTKRLSEKKTLKKFLCDDTWNDFLIISQSFAKHNSEEWMNQARSKKRGDMQSHQWFISCHLKAALPKTEPTFIKHSSFIVVGFRETKNLHFSSSINFQLKALFRLLEWFWEISVHPPNLKKVNYERRKKKFSVTVFFAVWASL